MKPKKGFISQTTTCNKEYKIVTNPNFRDWYWDEGKTFYPRHNRGYHNPNKRLQRYQMRVFKSWKHNRLTQYKT